MKHALLLLLAAGLVSATDSALWQSYFISPRTGASHLDLSSDWKFSWRDTQVSGTADLQSQSRWLPMARPTSVQMALHQAGELEHPYSNLNSKKYEWVDEKVWYFRKSFTAPPTSGRYAHLYFEGIDYFARIWLNGTLLGEHEGMFGGPAIEVSRHLLSGAANDLVVEVRAGNWGQKNTFKPRDPGRIIRPWVIAGGVGGEMFFPLGLWQGVRLEYSPTTHLERPYLVTRSASNAEATLHLSVELLRNKQSLDYQLHPDGNVQMRYYANWQKLRREAVPMEVEFTLSLRGSLQPTFRQKFPVSVLEGRTWLEQDIRIPSPKLWWPNGLGHPYLYQATVQLRQGGQLLDSIAFDYGIRHLALIQTPGLRYQDRWAPWQFQVNNRKLFLKGMNWMPADLLLDLPPERYHWLLTAARNAGIQLVRVWGGGLIEPEAFYRAANELGILVWQDFPIGNMFTPLYPQAIWEAQVMQTIFRLRNHPSLAVWCGGNEFNPYAPGNATSMGILERSLNDFDPSRPFRRSSPDQGSMHDYPDMDPTWFSRNFPYLPFMSEVGMHNIPNARTMREVVDAKELTQPLSRMYDADFAKRFPDFRHHFVEYDPARVPRMLSRASHIADIQSPSLDTIAEATQLGAAEFYQVFSEQLQANFPITTGLMPWVFKRPWPVVAIQTLDGFGHPTAPYYFLQRTYEPKHISWKPEHLLFAPGESVSLNLAAIQSTAGRLAGTARITILDDKFVALHRAQSPFMAPAGPSVTSIELGAWQIPASYRNRYFFVVAEWLSAEGGIVSRQVYWPRALGSFDFSVFRSKPTEWPTLANGPWLKPTVASSSTALSVKGLGRSSSVHGREFVSVEVTNTGNVPAFPVTLEVQHAKHSAIATDNFFWLAPGETKRVRLEILWRESAPATVPVEVQAWNAASARVSFARD